MSYIPRKLRELRINDRPTRNGKDMITGWEDAQRFLGTQPIEQPDIILCDVNFDQDTASPLNLVSAYKPTGLLYALPFLALARSNAVPIVLKFHTGDPTLFSRLHDNRAVDAGEKPPHFMSYLAAELVGLIIAMLQDSTAPSPVDLGGAWQWLGDRENTFETEEGARVAAKKEYRTRLGTLCQPTSASRTRLVVDPDGYQRLVEWCERVENKKSLDENDWDMEPGLIFLRPDGSRDCIAIRSLFHEDARFLPEAVAVRSGMIDRSGQPPTDGWLTRNEVRVGEFVHFLGDWPRICRRAAEVLRDFPCDGSKATATIAQAITDSEAGYRMARLLALFFQAIRLHWYAGELWKRHFGDTEWDPKNLKFGSPLEKNTLCDHLRTAYRLLRKKSEGAPMSPGSVMWILASEGWSGLDEDQDGHTEKLYSWVNFHVQILIGMGLVELSPDGQYVASNRSFPDEPPRCPLKLRPAFLTDLVIGLGESLGHDAKNAWSALRRIPAGAFFGGSSKKALSDGTIFLKDLSAGLSPGWLRELGREYALDELRWYQDSQWPDFLRVS